MRRVVCPVFRMLTRITCLFLVATIAARLATHELCKPLRIGEIET